MALTVSTTIEVCIFRRDAGRALYLLLRRSERERVYPGIWQYVTGSVHQGEKSVDAALRELREETGLEPTGFWIVPYVNSFYDRNRDEVNMSPLFAAEVPAGDSPRLSTEHSELGWFDYDESSRMLVWPGQREGLRIVNQFVVGGEQAAKLTRIR